jgi:drug/metabolite transporter (DMT)-like permease
MLPALLATVLFSWSVLFANRSAKLLGGVTANFARICLATALLAVWAHGFGGGLGSPGFRIFFLSGCVGFGLGDVALYQALPRLGSRLTILMVHCLAAPFAALTEWLWLGTTLTRAQIFFGIVILGGVTIALAPREHLHLAPKERCLGILFGTLAAFGQGFGAVLSRKAEAVNQFAGESIDGGTATYQRILGGLLITSLFVLWVKRRPRKSPTANDPKELSRGSKAVWRAAWPWVVLNSLAGPTLGVSCYQWALKTTPAGVVLPIVATAPVVIIPFAYLLDGDRPGLRSVIGGVIAVAGAIALTRAW